MAPGKTPLIATGLSGLVGSRFVELYQHKFDFTNLDLTTGVDITDGDQVAAKIKEAPGEIVLHFAAYTDVNKAETERGDKSGKCYQINVIGTQHVVKAVLKYKKHLIHISTDMVYDGSKSKPYTEDDPVKPLGWYGETKAMAEDVVRKNLPTYSIVRLSNPFRAIFTDKSDLVRNMIAKLQTDTLPPQFGDNWITPTFVDDLCKVFFMFTLKRPRGIYHATGSSWHSTFEVAELVKKVFGLPGTVTRGSLAEYNASATRPYEKSLKMTNKKLQEELGNPMLSLESALMIMKTQM